MVPETRRSLLHGVAGLAVALAGCSGLTGSSESTRTANGGSPSDDSLSDPEVLLVRSDGDRSLIWHGDRSEQTPPHRGPINDSVVVDTTAKADGLSATDSVDRGRINSFLDATDFDSETLYLQNIRVEECFRLELCRIEWQSDEVSTDYVRRLRPYTESCSAENRIVEARLIRIPDTLDADTVRSFGTSVGTGSCGGDRPRAESDGGGGSGASTGGAE